MADIVNFIQIPYVKENTLLDSNISDKVLKNIIATAEEVYLQELLGTTLFTELETGIGNNTLTAIQKTLVEKKILKYLLAVIESLSIDDLLVKYSESGIYSPLPNNSVQKTKDELKQIKISKEKKISTYAALIKSFIEDNITSFRNYESLDDIPAKKVNNAGVFLYEDEDDIGDYYYNNKRASGKYDESL